MATNVDLTVELERFAHECVEGGRYDNVSEVVRSGLRLLREAEGRRQHFRLMLEAATEEADRDGPFSLDAVSAEIDEIIGAAERLQAPRCLRRRGATSWMRSAGSPTIIRQPRVA